MSKVDEFIQLVDGTPEESERIRNKYPLNRRGRRFVQNVEQALNQTQKNRPARSVTKQGGD